MDPALRVKIGCADNIDDSIDAAMFKFDIVMDVEFETVKFIVDVDMGKEEFSDGAGAAGLPASS